MFNLFKRKPKEPSSGLFISEGENFVELKDETSKKSVNGIVEDLGYNKDQVHTILTFGMKNINWVGVIVFTKQIVFIQTEQTVHSISSSLKREIIKSIDWEFEYSSYNIEEILSSAIENRSFTANFLSNVFNVSLEPDSIITVDRLGYTLIFDNNLLVDFISADGLNKSAKTIQNLNEETLSSILLEAETYHNDISEALREVNIQADAWASTPQGYKNENIDLHISDMGNPNFFNLLLTHYNSLCNLEDFVTVNKGRMKRLDNNTYKVGTYIYLFENNKLKEAKYDPT